MRIDNFWDIGAWQEARRLTKLIYELTRKDAFSRDFGLARQIQRASVSVMANISEGFARRSNKEFARFLGMALGSNTEVQSHLFVALDLEYVDQKQFDDCFEQSKKVEKATNAFISYLKKK